MQVDCTGLGRTPGRDHCTALTLGLPLEIHCKILSTFYKLEATEQCACGQEMRRKVEKVNRAPNSRANMVVWEAEQDAGVWTLLTVAECTWHSCCLHVFRLGPDSPQLQTQILRQKRQVKALTEPESLSRKWQITTSSFLREVVKVKLN